MNIEKIMAIFTLFSNQSATEYLPLIQLSMLEVEGKLKTDADKTDARLNYLCGAIANMRYVEVDCSREKQMLTIGGGVAVNQTGERFIAARDIGAEYRKICADLLLDDDFLFITMKG